MEKTEIENVKGTQHCLRGKLHIKATLRVLTGMHIGASSDFAPIGAVDSPFIRDTLTKRPIIPGSSLKGKIRTLLAKSEASGYVLHDVDKDSEEIQALFGSAGKNAARPAQLQFFDCPMTEKSIEQFELLDTDTYIGEIKFENTINRITASANPRQIERVPAGAEFAFEVMYNIEDKEKIKKDIQTLAKGLKLLQMDYLGGHGSRGYGRVAFSDFTVSVFSLHKDVQAESMEKDMQSILIKESACI